MSSQLKQISPAEWTVITNNALHDLRTPLTTIQGYSKLLLSKQAADSKIATKLAIEAQRSSVLVDAFLTLLAMRQETLRLVWVVADLQTVLVRGKNWLKYAYPKDEIEFDIPANLTHTIVVDEHLFLLFFKTLFSFLLDQEAVTGLQITFDQNKAVTATICVLPQGNSKKSQVGVPDSYFLYYFIDEVCRLHHLKIKWHLTGRRVDGVTIIFPKSP